MGLILGNAIHLSPFPFPTWTQANEEETAHILCLLSTHHILRELSPDVFANNGISTLMDSGKGVLELRGYEWWVLFFARFLLK
jgi:hypothetical protein